LNEVHFPSRIIASTDLQFGSVVSILGQLGGRFHNALANSLPPDHYGSAASPERERSSSRGEEPQSATINGGGFRVPSPGGRIEGDVSFGQ